MKRILLLSTIFYPSPSVGSVRVTNWARVLPQLGYRPLVVCRDYGYRASRENLAEHVHPDVEVVQMQRDGRAAPAEDSMRPHAATKGAFSRRILSHLMAASFHKLIVPDVQMLFWNRVYPAILERVSQERPDVILATSPAFSVLEVGRRLKRDLGVPWIADFRDPMLLDDRFRPRGWARILWPRYARYEHRVYQEADAVLHAVPLHSRWARLHFPFARRRCAVLRHPVPADLASGLIEPIRSQVPGRRAVNVVGFIRPQVVGPLAQAVKKLVNEDPAQFDLELRLIGRPLDNPQPFQELLGERLIVTGRVRHDIAKGHIAGADVLVNAVSSERQHVVNVSSKLYEYAAARKPIVAINPTRSDRVLLREIDTIVVEEPTIDVLCDALRKSLARDPSQVADSCNHFIESHSWERHCHELATLLAGVTGRHGPAPDFRELDSPTTTRST